MGDSENKSLKMPGSGMIVGLLLIVAGVLLFLDNLNILPFETARAFWPLVLAVYCAAVFYHSGSVAVKVWAGTGVLAGILLLLGNYNVLHVTLATLWPLLLISTGIVMLIYRMRWLEVSMRFRHRAASISANIGANARTRTSVNRLQEFAIFSSVKRRVETASFEGGELSSVFGGIEIDLRRSAIAAASAVIEANAVFGGIELRIPENWRLSLQGNAVFGAYEDKTIPPRPEPGLEIPTLIIRGGAAFGGVVIRN